MLMSFSASFNLLSLRIQSSLLPCLCMICFAAEICQFNPKVWHCWCWLVRNAGAKSQIPLLRKDSRSIRRGSCILRLHSTVLLCRKYLHCSINFWKENIFIDRVLCTRKLKYSKKLMFKKGMHFGLNLRSVWKLPHQTYT